MICALSHVASPARLLAILGLGLPMMPVLAQSLPEESTEAWRQRGEEFLAQRLAETPNTNQARNIILFIGDGMGVSTVTAGRIFAGQQEGNPGEETVLGFERFSHSALVKTYNINAQVPDSAGTASAMLTGVKTKIGMVSTPAEANYGDCGPESHLPTLLDWAEESGRASGIITTTRITHATPASSYAHATLRDWEDDSRTPDGCMDIAAQLAGYEVGDGIEVVFGGGRGNFLPDDTADPEYADQFGRRQDGRNLIVEWQERTGGSFVFDQAGFDGLNMQGDAPVMGLFELNHMKYEADRVLDGQPDEPSLAQMVTKALEKLTDNEAGFFLVVEGGRIDHAHHRSNAYRALKDFQAFNQAIDVAIENTSSDDTLILVTADHSHVFTIAGYPHRGNDILGLVYGLDDTTGAKKMTPNLAKDQKPYTTLGYHNGPGAVADERPALDDDVVADHDYKQQALVPTGSETHAGEDVPLFASGPWAHLVGGVMEQHLIYHIIRHAGDRPAQQGAP